jgi:hypothetical protein
MPPEPTALEESLRAHFWNREPAHIEGMSERGHRIYRRQVRNNLFTAVKRALPISIHLAGGKAIDELIQAWLLAAPPQTRFYWELPVEFGTWIGSGEHATKPLALAELIQWEVMEIAVLNGPNATSPSALGLSKIPEEELGGALHPATRMGIYFHPVHRLTRDDVEWPKKSAGPLFIVGYRVGEKMHWLMVEAQSAQALAQLDEGKTVGQALDHVAQVYGKVDRPRIKAKLADLAHRGALLGFGRSA